MPNTLRTFVAINIDPKIQQSIAQIQNQLKKSDCNVKWVKPENIHLTLKFLGDVKRKKIDQLKQTLSDLFRDMTSIKTELTQLGAFPNMDRPRVLWVGLKDEDQSIGQLATSLEDALGKIGFKKDSKPFSAHITIGRIRSPRNLNLLSQAVSDYSTPTGLIQTIESVVLYASTLAPQGPIYDPLESFPLISD